MKKYMYERILVADDDKDTCRMLSSILEKEGYKVDKIYNSEQAIKKIKAKDYSLMILDYKLPDIDGINTFKVVHLAKPSLEVIMISAYGSPSIKSIAKKLGVYRFLDKPFDVKRLVKVVRYAMAKESGTICRSTGREVDRSSKKTSPLGTVPDLRAKP
jgi:two-component system response regulator AtoC